MRSVLLIALLSACTASSDDVTGPFTGETHRYVVDSFHLPSSYSDARDVAVDLDGDGGVDNHIGVVIGLLELYDDLTTHSADMIAAGTVASSVEITADDLTLDDSVSVLYIGADGTASTPVGGKLTNGAFRSNPTRTTSIPGATELHLPVYQDADPSILPLVGVSIDLDPDGAGGFNGVIRGGVPGTGALDAAALGMVEMIDSDPTGHRGMIDLFDAPPKDRIITVDEVTANDIISGDLLPDVTVPTPHGDVPVTSLAIPFHLTPCDSGRCAPPLFDHCFDRVRDADETDVDCGGSCHACQGGASCTVGADCETAACNAGTCAAASCTDGLRDGLETDVDCGQGCPACASDQDCHSDDDCAVVCDSGNQTCH